MANPFCCIACVEARSRLEFPRIFRGDTMAAAPVLPASPAQPAPLSEGARIVDTFISPSKTFTDLRRNASWWGPWLLISIFSVLFIYTIGRQIGFDQISRNQIAPSSRAEQF